MGTGTLDSLAKSDGLSKYGPLYNLTLDEVQHQLGDLGKPLNLDDLIKSVWTAETEADQALTGQNTLPASAASSADVSKKTLDGGRDMQKKKDVSGSDDDNSRNGKQSTLGEMTLEDFLAKAGIVASSFDEKKSSSLGNMDLELARWMHIMQCQVPPIEQQQDQVNVPGHHPVQQEVSDVPCSEAQMKMSSDTQMIGQKRVASEDLKLEKTVERKQERKMRNRESAARSRERKQAYTDALENKVSRLKEQNEILKREQDAEKALPPPPEPKYQLRRTSSF